MARTSSGIIRDRMNDNIVTLIAVLVAVNLDPDHGRDRALDAAQERAIDRAGRPTPASRAGRSPPVSSAPIAPPLGSELTLEPNRLPDRPAGRQGVEPDRRRRGCPGEPLPPPGDRRDHRARRVRPSRRQPRPGGGRPRPSRPRRHAQPECARCRPVGADRRRHGSGSSSRRRTRSRRSTTSSASARPATCGSNPAPSRCTSRSAGRAPVRRPASRSRSRVPRSGCSPSSAARSGSRATSISTGAPPVHDLEASASPA